ncbi:MAG TPA: hypothetical protein PK748_10775 [Acidimicrobiales bacterium]|jgi:hypothetical protein|nr:hypothetical protein [Acidimicrobiales bacterium]HMS86804.1 hypothetical protein [Acidimicrobiales bacterium]HRA35407.1 hypothetical protein [Acidimicrobiales bacterium]
MADLLFLVITVAFFAAAAGFVSVCDRVIGPDSDHADASGVGDTDDPPGDGSGAGQPSAPPALVPAGSGAEPTSGAIR